MNKTKLTVFISSMAMFALAGGLFASLGANGTSAVSAADGAETIENKSDFTPPCQRGLSEGDRQARFQEMEEKREEVRNTLESNDYNAWLEAAGDDCPMAKQVNEGNFEQFAQAHGLIQQGHDKLEDMGIERGKGRGQGIMGGAGCQAKGGMHGGMWR